MSDTQNNSLPQEEQNQDLPQGGTQEQESQVDETAGELEVSAAEETQASEEDEAKTPEQGDDLESEDDTQEVHSDEDEEDHPHELEMPDYAEYEPDALLLAAEELLKSQPVHRIKEHMESIRKFLLKHLNEERQHKLEEFIEQGGNQLDFEYVQPLRDQFRKIYQEYRKRRKDYYDKLQAALDQNLLEKKNLIERLKLIVTKEESIGETFKEFDQIREEWKAIGPVPRSESNDLWKTYHFHVENFYEYIKINKELRDLDYKKNQEAKEELIKKAEALLGEEHLKTAFQALQKLHKEWRQIGPVARELRDELWEKFSAATKALHEKREEFFAQMKVEAEKGLEQKRELVKALNEIPRNFDRHHQWQKAIKQVNEIQESFRKVGRLNLPENDQVWEEFREGLRNFNHAKNQFYKSLKREHHENLEKKRALLAKAEELKDSEEWREAANALKKIQADWKKIGHVPKSESDKIWKDFRAACNHFFDRLTQHNKQKDAGLAENLKLKEEFLSMLEKLELDLSDKKGAIKEIKQQIAEWKKFGLVPRNARQEIEGRFNKAIDALFKAIDLDRKESQRIRFENRLDSLAQQGDNKLQSERDFLKRKLDEAKQELNQLETNMSFFSSSNPNSPVVKEAQKSIDAQERVVENLQAQLKMLGQKIRDIKKAESEEAEKSED